MAPRLQETASRPELPGAVLRCRCTVVWLRLRGVNLCGGLSCECGVRDRDRQAGRHADRQID
eukprot:13788621-Alexandrium_andersonii.AAC.1